MHENVLCFQEDKQYVILLISIVLRLNMNVYIQMEITKLHLATVNQIVLLKFLLLLCL